MIFQALYDYAEREKLGDPDFEDVEIQWLVRLTKTGKFSGLEGLAGKEAGEKSRGKVFSCPYTKPAELQSGGKTHFLYDAIQKVLVWSNKKLTAEEGEKFKECQGFFIDLTEKAEEATKSVALKALVSFLRDKGELGKAHENLDREKLLKPSDKITFAVGDQVILEIDEVRHYWRTANKTAAIEKPYLCFVTGQATEGCETVGKLKGLPDGNPTGSPMISYDKEAFESFGLEKSFNAALSPEAEAKVRAGFQKLLDGVRPQSGAKFIWWTKKKADFDPLDLVNQADPEKVAELMKSVYEGRKGHGLEANLFYAMSLSGNGGRFMVRDWVEQKLEDTQRAVAKWFSDLTVVDKDGIQTARYPKLWELLGALTTPFQKTGDLPPQYFSGLVHAAFSGGPIPFGVYAAACRRQQLAEEKRDSRRMALIKIFLLRCQSINKGVNSMIKEKLNDDLKDPAYLCGRIFAVFDRLQYLALEGVNAGVVERFYAAACATPALVMGRLFRNAQFHLAKLKQSKGGAAYNVEKDFESLVEELKEWPVTLDLEGQGRFALGYYHQKAEYARLSQERKNLMSKEEGK